MVLHLVGLGLGDEKDITLRGLEVVKRSSRVFLEGYTSVLNSNKEALEAAYGVSMDVMHRTDVESGCDQMLELSRSAEIAFLVVGDPLCATTHCDLMNRAIAMGVDVKVVHNASIISAVGVTGMLVYKFGGTISVPFFDGTWRPDSFYHTIHSNQSAGLHTLCLLDIQMREQTPENLMRGNKIYEAPRYMTIPQCIGQLLELEQGLRQKGTSSLLPSAAICF
eukprot:GHVS01013697.1.p1 GENE.GHVS01013697.1~~GHVS01013697.1.p1  ORF type:complete len:222 (+),score=23.61 GHVS01013697.1:244-909(+)